MISPTWFTLLSVDPAIEFLASDQLSRVLFSFPPRQGLNLARPRQVCAWLDVIRVCFYLLPGAHDDHLIKGKGDDGPGDQA